MSSKHCVWLSVLAVVVLVGCDQGRIEPPRVPIHGDVTMDGQPAQEGEVRFVPTGEEGGPARGSFKATIKDGQYQVETAGGLQEGSYRVEVEVKEKTGKKVMIDMGTEMFEGDETVLISSAQHAGEDSPLTYTAGPGSETRFDIDVPPK